MKFTQSKIDEESIITCHDVANYFIAIANENIGEELTHLKLQKLVYYAQGFHLATYDKPLFNEIIEAWDYGPVVPELYHEYKKYKSNFIPMLNKDEINFPLNFNKKKELLNKVYSLYKPYSALELKDLTHKETPWKDYYGKGEISLESIKNFFKTTIINNNDETEIIPKEKCTFLENTSELVLTLTKSNQSNNKKEKLHQLLESWAAIFDDKIAKAKILTDGVIKEMLKTFLSQQFIENLTNLESKSTLENLNSLKKDNGFMQQLKLLSNNNLGEFELLATLLGIMDFAKGLDDMSLYGYDLKSLDVISIFEQTDSYF